MTALPLTLFHRREKNVDILSFETARGSGSKTKKELARGRRLWVMGNGGSACDAQHVAVEFTHPIIEKRRPLPDLDLVSQVPVLTAISNDKDFAKVFVDQLEIWGQPTDSRGRAFS